MTHISKVLIVFLVLLVAACTTPQDAGRDSLASEEDLFRIFARLGAGFGKDDNANAWVRKWVSPVRVSLVNARSPDDEQLVRAAFEKLLPLTGIPHEYPAKTGRTNFVVHFVKHADLKQEIDKRVGNSEQFKALPKGTLCFALPRGRNNIGYADIFVANDISDRIREICVLHEMLHAFGLIGHHQLFGPSILFHKDISQQQFSLNDRILLRTLYDPSISAGMPRKEALLAAKTLIARFRRDLLANGLKDDVLAQPLQW